MRTFKISPSRQWAAVTTTFKDIATPVHVKTPFGLVTSIQRLELNSSHSCDFAKLEIGIEMIHSNKKSLTETSGETNLAY
jgi:hypothetical protein